MSIKNQQIKTIEQCIDRNFTVDKIKTSEYQESGDFAVIDQGKDLIAGYYSGNKQIYNGELPTIIYGDHTNIVKYIDFPFICGADGVKVLTPKKEIYAKYFYYVLNCVKPETQGYRRHYPLLKNIEIPLPPLETQKAIVAKLDQIFAELDQTKSEIQKNLDNTDELWKSALNQAFQGDWEMKKLGEVCKIERGGSPRPIQEFLTTAENGVNWIKIGDTKTQPKYIEFTQEKIKPEGVKRSRMVYPGDFILSNSMSFGRPYIMKTSGCIHDGRLVLRPDNTVDKEFLYYLLGSDFMYKKFESTASGTGVKNLNIDKVKVIEISIPPLSEQEKIVEHLDQVSKEVKALKSQYQSQLDNLEELKKVCWIKLLDEN